MRCRIQGHRTVNNETHGRHGHWRHRRKSTAPLWTRFLLPAARVEAKPTTLYCVADAAGARQKKRGEMGGGRRSRSRRQRHSSQSPSPCTAAHADRSERGGYGEGVAAAGEQARDDGTTRACIGTCELLSRCDVGSTLVWRGRELSEPERNQSQIKRSMRQLFPMVGC